MTGITYAKEPLTKFDMINQPGTIIQEEQKAYLKHDQLFKDLIHHFFS